MPKSIESDEIGTYLGKKGYTIKKEFLSVQEQNLIRKELTMKPFVPKTSLQKPSSFAIYRESKNKLYVPRYYGIEAYGDPESINLNEGTNININFNGELRDFQKPIVEKFIKSAKKDGGGLLELHTGAGKTVLGLNILSKLKKKTLIVVHKEFLLRQWIERIEQFLPEAKVGKIQANVVDVEGKDIVIGMLQSLCKKNYSINIFEGFGFTIYDEVHHIGAEVFSNALFKTVTKYNLGLSATMKRKDGLSKIFKMFLGNVIFKKERKGEDNVLVKAIEYYNSDEEFSKVALNYRGHTNYSTMIKKLCEFNRRSEFILKVLKDILKKGNEEQQIMILAHNKSLLQYLYDAIEHRNIATVGYYIGGMKEHDLKMSESKKVIIATYAMAEEGLDIKTLTTLLMATPKVDVTQSIGRILRKKRKESLVIDIVDQHPVFQRHWSKRKTFYKKQKFKVIKTDNSRYDDDKWETILDIKNNIFRKSKKSKIIKVNTDVLETGKCMVNMNLN
jgi:superfamily II DNA or RNA helicase